jgi:erythronate-4-phosphate dehydrogenase
MAKQADGLIIRTRTRCDADLLEGSKVKFIATATIGFDHIDTIYCKKNNISWHHAPGCNSASVRQYIASALINLAKKHDFELTGKKLGVIGVGNVGSKVAQLAGTLGMLPVLNDPPRARDENNRGFVSLDEILETCEIITLHVPLALEGPDMTYKMADKNFFTKLGKKPYLINTSRGEVVDTLSVKNAIISGKIAGLVADVWENEPVADLELLKVTDIATPHIAGYSAEGKANGTSACVRAASRFFGFGLDNWYPTLLPGPENPLIEIDPSGKTDLRIISEAILASYDVMIDDAHFRHDISQFENLRNFYPVRREFPAFNIRLQNPKTELLIKLKSLGFNISADSLTTED